MGVTVIIEIAFIKSNTWARADDCLSQRRVWPPPPPRAPEEMTRARYCIHILKGFFFSFFCHVTQHQRNRPHPTTTTHTSTLRLQPKKMIVHCILISFLLLLLLRAQRHQNMTKTLGWSSTSFVLKAAGFSLSTLMVITDVSLPSFSLSNQIEKRQSKPVAVGAIQWFTCARANLKFSSARAMH